MGSSLNGAMEKCNDIKEQRTASQAYDEGSIPFTRSRPLSFREIARAVPPGPRPVCDSLAGSRSGRSMVADDLIVIVIDPGSYQEPLLAGQNERISPSLAGEGLQSVEVLPGGDDDELAASPEDASDMQGHQAGLPMHQGYSLRLNEAPEIDLHSFVNLGAPHSDDHVGRAVTGSEA